MANWIPKNKATGVEYPPVDDAGKAEMEAYHLTKGKYTFKQTDAPATPKDEQTAIVAKMKQKKPLKPIGVDEIEAPAEGQE